MDIDIANASLCEFIGIGSIRFVGYAVGVFFCNIELSEIILDSLWYTVQKGFKTIFKTEVVNSVNYSGKTFLFQWPWTQGQ